MNKTCILTPSRKYMSQLQRLFKVGFSMQFYELVQYNKMASQHEEVAIGGSDRSGGDSESQGDEATSGEAGTATATGDEATSSRD